MTDQTEKTIQGLYPASGCEGRFWLLLARVLLVEFVKKEGGFDEEKG